jgi:hypothetical protein
MIAELIVESGVGEVACAERLGMAADIEIPETGLVGTLVGKPTQNEAEPTQTLMMTLRVSEPLVPVTVTL